ncbi:MAG: hypothetical protein IKL87_05740 [Oscillospiraceae bacterium]|nr:hypothetical protein [Oscillospiraceae bacterium]
MKQKISGNFSLLLRKLRKHIHPLRPSNLKLLILSGACAVILWMFIATRVNTGIDIHLSQIPVSANIAGTQAESYGLTLLTTEDELPVVHANISGKRTSIGAISKDDVVAYVDFNSASDRIGKQKLPILLKTLDGTPLGNYQLSTSEVTVTLDRFDTITVPVREVLRPNLSYSDDVNIESIDCEPAAVEITGPSLSLAQIDHVRVIVPDSEKLFETKSFSTTQYELIDADNNIITDSSLQTHTPRFLTKVSVSYTHELPVTIELSGAPSGFDTQFLLERIRLNGEYVLPGFEGNTLPIGIKTLEYADKVSLDSLKEMCIKRLPLSALSLGEPVEISVELQDGYEDISNLGKIYLSLDDTDLVAETRWVYTRDIKPINNTADFDYQVQAGRFQVTLIGSAEQVAEITSDDITATIDLYNDPITEVGTFPRSVSFTLPETANRVWVSGSPKLNITATTALDKSNPNASSGTANPNRPAQP